MLHSMSGPRRNAAKARAVALLLTAVFVVGCYTGPGVDHYAAILDELAIPDSWDLIKSETRGPDGDTECGAVTAPSCPAATRTYISEGDPLSAFAAAEELVESSGFTVSQEFDADCEGPPQGAACVFTSSRGDDRVLVSVFRSVTDAGLSDAPSDGTTIHVVATDSYI